MWNRCGLFLPIAQWQLQNAREQKQASIVARRLVAFDPKATFDLLQKSRILTKRLLLLVCDY
jgi:hypothetical protein